MSGYLGRILVGYQLEGQLAADIARYSLEFANFLRDLNVHNVDKLNLFLRFPDVAEAT